MLYKHDKLYQGEAGSLETLAKVNMEVFYRASYKFYTQIWVQASNCIFITITWECENQFLVHTQHSQVPTLTCIIDMYNSIDESF